MRALAEAELLEVWELGLAHAPARRGLDLLTRACPDEGRERVARLSIGLRDRWLLALRRLTFGDECVCRVPCPMCGQVLEATVDAGDILGRSREEATALFEIDADGYQVLARLPDSRDLLALERAKDLPTGISLLVQRCVLAARCDNTPRDAADLPESVVGAIERRMAELDPEADWRLGLACPACGHTWEAAFDVLAFFWAEVDGWARRTLREIRLLAARYGWSEADTLKVSARRRSLYLESDAV